MPHSWSFRRERIKNTTTCALQPWWSTRSSFDYLWIYLSKYVVLITPTLHLSRFPVMDGPFVIDPTHHSPIMNHSSFVVWNIRGGHNPNFRHNFRELLNTHNPCMIALLETQFTSYLTIKEEFGFDDYFEYPTTGRSGIIVLLWNISYVIINRIRQTTRNCMQWLRYVLANKTSV